MRRSRDPSNGRFIAYPGSAYAADWSNLLPGLTVVPVLFVAAFVVIPFFRRVVGMSAYEHFGRRFGSAARVYSSITCSLGHFSKMGFVFYLLALTVGSITGWLADRIVIVVGAVTVAYTLIGGIEAMIRAGVVQGFVLRLGILICLGYPLFLPDAGPGASHSRARPLRDLLLLPALHRRPDHQAAVIHSMLGGVCDRIAVARLEIP